MNARQKAKYYKKKYEELFADYIYSAAMSCERIDMLIDKIAEEEARKFVTGVEKQFDKPVAIDEDLAIEMWEQLTYDELFRRAVTFEGHTHPVTGKYILEAKLTVVMPEFEEESER